MFDDKLRACRPPSTYRLRAQLKQIANGNDPECTRLTRDERNDRTPYITLGPEYQENIWSRIQARKEEEHSDGET